MTNQEKRVVGFMQDGEINYLYPTGKDGKFIMDDSLIDMLSFFKSLNNINDRLQFLYDNLFGYKPYFFTTKNFIINNEEVEFGINIRDGLESSKVGSFIISREKDSRLEHLEANFNTRLNKCDTLEEEKDLIIAEINHLEKNNKKKLLKNKLFSEGYESESRKVYINFPFPLTFEMCMTIIDGAIACVFFKKLLKRRDAMEQNKLNTNTVASPLTLKQQILLMYKFGLFDAPKFLSLKPIQKGILISKLLNNGPKNTTEYIRNVAVTNKLSVSKDDYFVQSSKNLERVNEVLKEI